MQSELIGSTEARIYTPKLYEWSLGDVARQFSEEILELELFPWQRWLFDMALELREPWTDESKPPPFRYETLVVLVARQNGKSTVLKIRALCGLFLWRERLAISLAQTRDVAFETWRDAALMCEQIEKLREHTRHITRSNGKEAIELLTGSRWKVVAANDSSRGFAADTVFVDELRTHKNHDVWSAVEKTRRAKINSQVWAFSNAGTEESVVLNEMCRIGRDLADDPERNPSFGYYEWSAPDDMEPTDVAGWRAANPALGFTITERKIRNELATDQPEAFRAEVLCQRVNHMGTWISPAAWNECADTESAVPANARVTFAVHADSEQSHVLVAAAAPLPDGRVHVELAADYPPLAGSSALVRAAREVPALLERWPDSECVYASPGPLAVTCDELAGAGLPIRPLSRTDVTDACNRFRELVITGRLVHRADPLLAQHVANAAENRSGDAWRFTPRHAGGPVAALVAAVLATHVARAPAVKPANWTVF